MFVVFSSLNKTIVRKYCYNFRLNSFEFPCRYATELNENGGFPYMLRSSVLFFKQTPTTYIHTCFARSFVNTREYSKIGKN